MLKIAPVRLLINGHGALLRQASCSVANGVVIRLLCSERHQSIAAFPTSFVGLVNWNRGRLLWVESSR